MTTNPRPAGSEEGHAEEEARKKEWKGGRGKKKKKKINERRKKSWRRRVKRDEQRSEISRETEGRKERAEENEFGVPAGIGSRTRPCKDSREQDCAGL